MLPRVDMDRVPTPAASVSTAENNSRRLSAQPLMKEKTMRHTTRFSLATLMFATACMGQVGGDDDKRDPRTDKDTGCTNPKEVKEAITIRSDADFSQVPTGCWDLYAKLRIEGAGIGSL